VRFSNANTTTDRYPFGAVPGFAHTLLNLAAAVEEAAAVDDDDGAVVVVVAGACGVDRAEDELHPAATVPMRASTAAHRRNETARGS
jgi:hypothetical protein